MPGIHVRSSSKLDWVKREKEPVLTVPGAYWLCHKNYIYKFTFTYHKNSIDTKDFNNGRELMKVIRRIIRSQPRQGQQFGTRHLVVTYHSSSWTRQDKMFALLKFRDRPIAKAFPKAFVLTVKIISTNQESASGKQNDHVITYNKNFKPSVWEVTDSNETKIDHGLPREVSNGTSVTIDEASSNSSMKFTPTDAMESKIEGDLLPLKVAMNNRRPKKTNSASFFADIDDLPLVERYIHEQNDDVLTSNGNNHNFVEVQETVDMPYQYLIEREIERSKINSAPTNFITRHSNRSLPFETYNRYKPSREIVIPRNRLYSSSQVIDNATARSANITDLVMEGLMFSISEKQDSLSIEEQKTKLEPDEVLENSEKVETSEGAECLVNSSLLKLENLITKIEMSASSSKSLAKCEPEKTSMFLPNPLDDMDPNLNDSIENSQISRDDEEEDEITLDLELNKQINPLGSTDMKIKKNLPLLRDHHPPMSAPRPLVKIELHNVKDVLCNTFSGIYTSKEKEIEDTANTVNKKESNREDKLENRSLQYNEIDKAVVKKCDVDERGRFPKVLYKDVINGCSDKRSEFPSDQINESNLLINNLESGIKSGSSNGTDMKMQLKVPRIVSTEIVQYNLTDFLRSSRLRPRLDKLPDVNENTTEIVVKKSQDGVPTEKMTPPDIKNIEEPVEMSSVMTRRRLIAKRQIDRCKYNEEKEMVIKVSKLLSDMTQGVRVVLHRLDLSRISDVIGKRSSTLTN